MSDKCCQHCLEKVQTTTEDSPPEKTMSCKHAEDVCQDCLQKVQREEEEEEEEEEYSPQKTNTEKANDIFVGAIAVSFIGYVGFWSAKLLKKSYDLGMIVVKDILENLLD